MVDWDLLIYNNLLALNNHNVWFRHSVLSLLLDVTDAEFRAISRFSSTSTNTTSVPSVEKPPTSLSNIENILTSELTASSSAENMDISESLASTAQSIASGSVRKY